VPQLPPSNLVYDLSGPYQHFGPEIVLYADGTWSYLPAHIPRDLISGKNWREISFQDVGDHQMKNYLERIKAAE
jgi:triacylglycerol lipase